MPSVRLAEPFRRYLRILGVDGAPSGPDVHTVVRVTLGGREYHVDVGSAAPFYERVLSDLSELRHAADAEFLMPRCPVERAVAILECLAGRDFFSEAPWADAV